MSPEQIEDALQGYVHLIAESRGYWPEDDHEEYSKWQAVNGDDFHPDALNDIRGDLLAFWALLQKEMEADVVVKMYHAAYTFHELGGDLWMSRQRTGIEYDTGDETLDRALDRASEALGEAYVELGGNGMVYHN